MMETRGLRKSFTSRQGREKKTVDAVRGVDLDVAEGEIFGFLGPNGAGKTTTLRMLATLLTPDGGSATIAGVDLIAAPAAVRRVIGYVAQGGSTWDDSTAREELILQARLYGASRSVASARAARVLDAFQLTEYADRRCKTYSGGQRRRVDDLRAGVAAGHRRLEPVFVGGDRHAGAVHRRPGDPSVWQGLLIMAVLAVAAVVWAARLFARSVR